LHLKFEETFFFRTLVRLAAAALRWHHHRKIKIKNFEKKFFFFFFGFLKNQIDKELQFD
jgi:hypothetical protein